MHVINGVLTSRLIANERGAFCYWNCYTVKTIASCPMRVPRNGYLVGWSNSGRTICVATVCENLSVGSCENATVQTIVPVVKQKKIYQISELSSYLLRCQPPVATDGTSKSSPSNPAPTVLGVLANSESNHLSYPKPGNEDFWLSIFLNSELLPEIRSIYDKNEQSDRQTSVEIIFYDQPNPEYLQYLALDPLVLDLSAKATSRKLAYATDDIDTSSLSKSECGVIKNVKKIVEQSRVMASSNMDEDVEDGNLRIALDQINSSFYLEKGIKQLTKTATETQRPHIMVLSAIMRFAERLKAIFLYIFYPIFSLVQALRSFIIGPGMGLLFVVRFVIEIILYILNLQLPKWILNGVALKDLSAAALQVDLRLQQLCFWPGQYMLIRKMRWANTAATRAQYISMWLIANDIIIGVTVGSFLINNSYEVSITLHDILNRYTVDPLQMMMDWLLRSPGGLKLNDELGKFLSELFSWLIRLWIVCIQNIRPTTPLILKAIGMSGIFGVSMIISLSSDLLAFMTLHVYWFYMVAARIFNWQFTILYSLFNLFRGKKRNVLRHRIDSCDYDLDQLLLGTSLFTLLMFLFPTVLSYYLTFASGRVGIIFSQAIMETLLAFFNHFPLFAIMLRIKDPGRLPGGLTFEVCQPDLFINQRRFIRFLNRQRLNIAQAWKKQAMLQQPEAAPANEVQTPTTTTKPTRGHRPKQRSVHFHDTPKSEYGLLARQLHICEGRCTGQFSTASPMLLVTHLTFQNLPIPFGAIFFQYMLLWKRLSAHYFSTYVLTCLLYGEPIKPIPKLQYPMLPDNR
ncbi:hypothetical protein INT44_006035 [Umbelopsis vinacea]|uniref:Uncharacterized protein n=1 Tax=Umbelopsis vinacea TaxID=44442 RepID=A0A8H7ULB5_9FUNG|nr:hypothetical protein INT44_006035 [Umbelopsis vinacea]